MFESQWQIRIPLWFVEVLVLVLPLRWYAKLRRDRRRLRASLCPACGYDLRATPDRCPECGAVPAAEGEQA
jgi:predicted amidophosphoribosyltransferase